MGAKHSHSNLAYFDNAATTPVDPRVLKAMAPYHNVMFGNPQATHMAGVVARDAMEAARAKIANLLKVPIHTIYFTGGASEGINTFLRGVVSCNTSQRRKIVIGGIEHKAVSSTADDLKTKGFEVVKVDVTPNGVIDLHALQRAVDFNTLIVAVMYVNNEIGTIQPVKHIANVAHSRGALFFCDTTQATGKFPVHPRKLGIDGMCLSAHKMNGPKGVGALYIRDNISCTPLITGGMQEMGQRAGTSNVPGIVGLAVALDLHLSPEGQRAHSEVRAKRIWIERELGEAFPWARVNGAGAPRVDGILSISLPGVDNHDLTQYLDQRGLMVSTGSACNSGMRSPVLSSLGCTEEEEVGTLRISLGPQNTWAESRRMVNALINYFEE